MKKILSSIAALAIAISSFSGITASAGVVDTVRNYTFENELVVTDQITGWRGTYNVKADGYDNLLFGSGGWLPEVNSVAPQFERTAAAARTGSYGMQIRVSGGRLYFNIPATETTAVTKTYKITIPMKLIGLHSGQGWVYGLIGAADPTSNAAVTSATGGKIFQCTTSAWSAYTYTGTFDASVDSTVTIKPVGDYTFAFDDITIEEMGAATVTKVAPADGSVNVTQYDKPVITFDAALNADTISNITLASGTKTVTTTNTLSTDGLSVTMTPAKKLEPNTEYTITVPATVLDATGMAVEAKTFKFTTGDKNMVLEYDFDNATAEDLKLIYGTSQWEGTYSLGTLSGSNALKISLPTQSHWAMLVFPKAMNADASRKFIVSFDMLSGASDRKWTDIYWFHKYQTETNLGRYDSNSGKVHYEFVVDSTAWWDAGLKFANPTGVNSNAILIDNIKVEYLDEIRLTSSTVSNGQSGVMTNTPVTVAFNKAVFGADEVAIYDFTDEEEPTPVDGTTKATTDSLGRTVITIEHGGLKTGTLYGLDLSCITDADGKYLDDEDQAIYFTTSDFVLTGNELFVYEFEGEANDDKGISNGLFSKWAVKYDRTTEAASGGKYSLKVDTDPTVAENGGNMYFSIPNMNYMQYSGNVYKMKLDMKDNLDEGISNVSFILYYETDGGVRHYKWLAQGYDVEEEFATLERNFIINETTNIYNPSIYMLINDQASFYIDNFVIEKTDEPIITLYGDGAEIMSGGLSATNNVKAEYANIPESTSYIGVIALYKDGKLIDLDYTIPTSAGGEDNEITVSLPEDTTDCKVKAFLWDSLTGMESVIEYVQAG